MEIVIKGNPQEITEFVRKLQGQNNNPQFLLKATFNQEEWKETARKMEKEFTLNALKAIRGKHEEV